MSSFNNETYEILVSDLLNDAFYLDGASNRGKIATIRSYAEVIVRKILNLKPDCKVTLGNDGILKSLREYSSGSPMLMDSINKIRILGNKCTHTQEVAAISDDEVRSALDSLFSIYAYLFVDYFSRNKFGSNSEVVSKFSILPPIIRFITLKNLYDVDNENIVIIDKLSLAILKACGEGEALKWLRERREMLSKMKPYTDDYLNGLMKNDGASVYWRAINRGESLFSVCEDKIISISSTINQKGNLYHDFEGALDLFKSEGRVEGDSLEVIEFNLLMEFVYLGRKPKKNDRLDNRGDYLIVGFESLSSKAVACSLSVDYLDGGDEGSGD